MNSITDYPRSRAFARLERALAKLYSNPIEYEHQLSAHIQMFFTLGRTQGFAIASQTMSEIAEHYEDRYWRPGLWFGMANARLVARATEACRGSD